MSRYSKAAKQQASKTVLGSERVTNFMGGDSFKPLDPLERLKMVAASSIFGEPKYYDPKEGSLGLMGCKVTGMFSKRQDIEFCRDIDIDEIFLYRRILEKASGKTTQSRSSLYEELINESLDYDYEGTLEWAVTLRRDYFMRLNPQVIMVLAALHPKRKEFTKKNPGLFSKIEQQVMMRADEPMVQLAYYLFKHNGDKANIPSVLKRALATKLSSLRRYEVSKYKNAEIGMINAVRITHATSTVLNELMRTGTVEVDEKDDTWERLRSAGESWYSILGKIKIGHMALLRNLRGIATEFEDDSPFRNTQEERQYILKLMEDLKKGVKNGKQFPFRYYSAYNAMKEHTYRYTPIIISALEECIDIAIDNLPKLSGRTMCLSDNSGSAWGACTSEYGSVQVAVIDNLSSVIAAKCSDEGVVGKFGDKLIRFNISTRDGALSQTQRITEKRDSDVGPATEGGIWEFFRDAIKKCEHFDNIFIFSDQQAGTGGLYGTDSHMKEYGGDAWRCKSSSGVSYRPMLNVWKLIQMYRQKVNPKVNVFSIQTAGYNNNVIPIMGYRTALLYGWTGKEILFASEYIRQWDEIEEKRNPKRERTPHKRADIPQVIQEMEKKQRINAGSAVPLARRTGVKKKMTYAAEPKEEKDVSSEKTNIKPKFEKEYGKYKTNNKDTGEYKKDNK